MTLEYRLETQERFPESMSDTVYRELQGKKQCVCFSSWEETTWIKQRKAAAWGYSGELEGGSLVVIDHWK